jgi:hypothetical protein
VFDIWTSELEQDQDQDEIQVQILAEIQSQELNLDQDTRPQKRRYPLRKCQLTTKAAVLII